MAIPLDKPSPRARAAALPRTHAHLLTDPKLPFAIGPADYLAIVRIKPAQGRGETVGVLGRYRTRRRRRKDARQSSSPWPARDAVDLLAPAGCPAEAPDEPAKLHQLPWLRC
jgi:hypothetical protein